MNAILWILQKIRINYLVIVISNEGRRLIKVVDHTEDIIILAVTP